MKDRKAEKTVREAAAAINAEPEQLAAAIGKFRSELESAEKEIASLRKRLK